MNDYRKFIGLFLIAMLDIKSSVAEEEVAWPLELRPMTQQIFTPYLRSQYTHIQGLARFKKQADDLDHYILRAPRDKWVTPQKCDLPARQPGFIQTTKYVNDADSYTAKIAVPISLELRTSFLNMQKEHLLNTTLMTIKVLALDGDDGDEVHPGLNQDQIEDEQDVGSYQLVQLQKFNFTFRQLCQLTDDCRPLIDRQNTPILLSLNRPIVTTPFELAKGNLPYLLDPATGRLNMVNRGKIRIRVEWDFQGVCDEDHFTFKVGDQIRIIEHL